MKNNIPIKNLNQKFIGKKISYHKKLSRIFSKNPLINAFNYDSHFIYDQADSFDYFSKLSQKNNIKLTEDEISLLQKNINEIELEKSLNDGKTFLKIPQSILESLNNFKNCVKPETEIDIFIKNKINNSINRADITCRKIATQYYNETGKFIGKSSVNNIMKNKLGYRYIKTTYKTNYLRTKEANILSLCFVKIIARLIKFNYEIVFLDESKIESINTHLKCWRKPRETIYFGNYIKKKLNIIMAISKNKVLRMDINEENTTAEIYLNFLKNLYEDLSKEKNKKFAIILDNLKLHKTKDVISFCEEKKINLVFNVPYQSIFNGIELCFRSMKKIIYSNIYNSVEEIKEKLLGFINEEKFKNSLLYNYKETLTEYLFYAENHKYDNLNLLEYI